MTLIEQANVEMDNDARATALKRVKELLSLIDKTEESIEADTKKLAGLKRELETLNTKFSVSE